MTNEERDLITRFIERVGGAAQPAGFAGSVAGSGSAPALPPIDRDADALIGELFGRNKEAPYRITQLAFVQEQALAAQQQRIQALEQQMRQMQQQAQSAPSPWGAPPEQQRGGFFSNLFGGGTRPQAPPPGYQPAPQQYAPQYAAPQGMMQPQGSGFLGGALQTAAGVAGGVIAGQALMNLFSGGGHGGGGFGSDAAMSGGGFGGGSESGWVGGGQEAGFGGADPLDQGGALKDTPVADQGGWQPVAEDTGWQPAPDNGGWDGGAGGDSGWTDSDDT